MAMRSFYNQIKGKKLTEVPEHIKPMLNKKFVVESFEQWKDRYYAKYIETSSVEPLFHVCLYGMAFSFIIAIPEELRHYRHQQHEKAHAAH